ncbi:dTMP kinase [Caulobacter segnis]
MYAARRDHVERVIRPALAQGKVVLCDRFADSAPSLPGRGRRRAGQPDRFAEEHVLGGTVPVLTLILDLPAEVGLRRAEARGLAPARFERSKGLDFHQRLHALAIWSPPAADPSAASSSTPTPSWTQ